MPLCSLTCAAFPCAAPIARLRRGRCTLLHTARSLSSVQRVLQFNVQCMQCAIVCAMQADITRHRGDHCTQLESRATGSAVSFVTAVQSESQAIHSNQIYCAAMCSLDFSPNVCAMRADIASACMHSIMTALAHHGGTKWEPILIQNMGAHSHTEHRSTFSYKTWEHILIQMGGIAGAAHSHTEHGGTFRNMRGAIAAGGTLTYRTWEHILI